MRILDNTEIQTVSGAGFIQDNFANIGESIGDIGYKILGPYYKVTT